LNFRGSLKKDYDDWRNLDYVLSVGGGNPGAPVFLDAYLNYNILPANQADAARLAVSFGQQTKPFGLEASALEDKKPVINQAQFVAATSFVQRDVGIVFKGDLFPSNDFGYGYRVPLLEYTAGVVNGNNFNQASGVYTGNSHPTTGKDKFDTLGRIVINPIAWDISSGQINYNDILRGFSIGASEYTGSSQLGFDTDDNKIVTGIKNRKGFDVSYVRNPIGFTYETITAEDETGAWANSVKTKKAGNTLTVFLEFGEQFVNGYRAQSRTDDWWPLTWQPFVRFDNWNANTNYGDDNDDNKKEIKTIGLNIFFAETTKFQINHNITNQKSTETKNAAETIVQFQYGF
jgi:hypothetical protein